MSPVRKVALLGLTAAAALGTAVCVQRPEAVPPAAAPPLPSVSAVAEDTTHKEDLRLVPAEAYVRTYLTLFGGLAPLEVQKKARGADGALLFDAWDDYLLALGLPDYRADMPRGTQTNAIMLAAFERLGAALCDRSLEHDWKGKTPVAADKRLVFAFDPTPDAPTKAQFTAGFDVLHRTFLGYPADLAPTDRVARFHRLFEDTRARHAAKNAPKTRLSPVETAWVTVCEGLVRHPEFHFY
jgi:hypothetical protein